eukprot:GFUD01002617.1.p1 GENE.GFUD01002617.1~~GFUD01002617.1.p1  ORF type:complete len:211 (+),score=3.75 GFUD01002617.1:109-741(+)
MKRYVATLVLSLIVLGVCEKGGKNKGECRNPTGKIGQTAVCQPLKIVGIGYWKVVPECDPVVSGLNWGEFNKFSSDDITFQAFNVVKDQNDSRTGTVANYWLANDDTIAPVGRFFYDIGCSKIIHKFVIKNTHNAYYNDRGTAKFSISVRNAQTEQWKNVVNNTLQDVRHNPNPPLEVFPVRFRFPVRFVRFMIESFYGTGGGLQFFAPI